MEEYKDLLNRLKEISKIGYVRTHRAGNTGVGKTLEDLLGIKENNIPGPNGRFIELKSARKNSNTMLTLFTKSPEPAKINTKLLEIFGYDKGMQKILHVTLKAQKYTPINGKPTMKIGIEEDKLTILLHPSIQPRYPDIKPYWSKDTLKKVFERKLPKLLYVKADSKCKGKDEEFWYNEAWLLAGFDFTNFINAISEGWIVIDIRIGRYNNGRVHDHGTAFRIRQDKLESCFNVREKIL